MVQEHDSAVDGMGGAIKHRGGVELVESGRTSLFDEMGLVATDKYEDAEIPETLGACADKLHVLKQEKARLNIIVKSIDKWEKKIKDHIINTLPKSDLTGASGHLANVRVVKKIVPTVEDWASLYDYIKTHDAFDLMQRRVSSPAVQARWDQEEEVPGVTKFAVVSVSLTKATK